MTNVHDRHHKSLDNSNIKAGQNAALRGALLAFAKPPLILQNPHHASRPSSAYFAAPTSRKNKPDQERRPLSPNVASHNLSLQNRVQNSVTGLPTQSHDVSRPASHDYFGSKPGQLGLVIPVTQERSRSKSPSSIAAGLAVVRRSPQNIERPVSALRVKAQKWPSSMDNESRARLNPQNTVGHVKSWLDHVDGASPSQNPHFQQYLQRAYTGPATYSFGSETLASPRLSSSIQRPNESIYESTAVSYQMLDFHSSIESPIPVRASSRVASVESAALVSSSEASMADKMYRSSHDERDIHNAHENLYGDETNRETTESELDGTADEEEQIDQTWNGGRLGFATDIVTDKPEERSSSRLTVRPIPVPKPKPRPPPSLRPVMDARRKLENAKRGVQPAAPGWQPSSAHHVESLANAMIASSLAASRAPSPVKSPAPPLTRRHTDHPHLQIAHIRIGRRGNRSPSPPRAMPHTLRKAKSSSDEEDNKEKGRIRRVKRGLHIHKHPHKHHEGDRKRWRDEITPRECKRYEGLWAANRGLLIELEPGTTPDPLNSHVSNIIVRDIWTRSRLPAIVLEEVWDLVDREQTGKLTKEQFVVGMWLVDQRLKGRKLPAKVGQSVWRSARGLYGLKVPRLKD